MSISVKNVTKIYGAQKALDNVSFEVKTGEIVGFLGPNGAGKSTMMKIITCFLPQSAGEVRVAGHDVTETPIEVKKRVGYLPEHNPHYLEMYVREYLRFVAGVHGAPKSHVEEMIEKTGLTPESHKKIGQLSKGFRQRVGLAQAMVHNPEVLILDEPTTGLDPNQLVEIRELIKTIGKEKTVMLSTHIMQEVEILCNRVIIINKGKIVADRPTEELRKIGEETLVKIEFEQPVNPEELKSLPGVLSVSALSATRFSLSGKPGTDIRQELFKFAVAKNIAILQVNLEEQKLEDVFQKLTR